MTRPRHQASPGRVAAARALLQVEEGRHADAALRDRPPPRPDDRRMAWHLVLGVLRRRASIDAALRPWLDRPLHEVDPPVRAVLRMAAFDKLVSRTPEHVAVHQAVETCRALGVGRASGLVNAVLRRVVEPSSLSREERLEHPAWLIERWDARYGPAATDAWCLANAEAPPTFIVARGEVAPVVAALAGAGVEAAPVSLHGVVVPGVLRLGEVQGPLEELPGFAEGAWWVQDAASAWMADLVPERARTVLDACAAPGGKTLRLLARGKRVVAIDRDEGRLDALRGRLARTGLRAEVHQHDWLRHRGPDQQFDCVLVDAPCTGLGTVRRRPDVRWRRSPLDPMAAADRQRVIVRAAARHVRDGGALVYVVCSAEPEEGPGVVASLAEDGWVVVETRTTAPPEQGEDAFWGALLERR